MKMSSPISARRQRGGFTLMELLIAMAVGIVLINAAMVSFMLFRKAVLRTERLVAQNTLYQGMMQWVATNGEITNYPTGKQVKQLGRTDDPAHVNAAPLSILGREVVELRLKDYSTGGVSDIPPLYFVRLTPSTQSTSP